MSYSILILRYVNLVQYISNIYIYIWLVLRRLYGVSTIIILSILSSPWPTTCGIKQTEM